MPFYEYACDECKEITIDMRPMKRRNYPHKCEHCGKKIKRVLSMPAACYDPLKPLDFDPKKMGVNVSKGARTPAQQEREYGKIIEQSRKDVKQKTRDEKFKGGDDPYRMHMQARIPRELFSARTRQFGKDYWIDEGKKALKRDGLLLED